MCFQKSLIDDHVTAAKKKFVIRELAILRASKPKPPMVSHLDKGIDESVIKELMQRQIATPTSGGKFTNPSLSPSVFLL